MYLPRKGFPIHGVFGSRLVPQTEVQGDGVHRVAVVERATSDVGHLNLLVHRHTFILVLPPKHSVSFSSFESIRFH